MNYKFYLIILTILIVSCSDDSEHGPYGADNIPPGQVTVNEVVNTAGGAIIYFTPPNDEDLLYPDRLLQNNYHCNISRDSN